MEREPSRNTSTASVLAGRPPPHPKFSRLRNSKSQEDLLGTPLKPEITGAFTPPRGRPISGRFSESDLLSKKGAISLDIPSVQVTQVSIGNSLQSTPKKHLKIHTLPADMKEMSLKDLAKKGKVKEEREGSRSAEPRQSSDSNSCLVDETARKKTKSPSPSIGQMKRRGHSKSQSVGTK